jgi:hypothetical protein
VNFGSGVLLQLPDTTIELFGQVEPSIIHPSSSIIIHHTSIIIHHHPSSIHPAGWMMDIWMDGLMMMDDGCWMMDVGCWLMMDDDG